MYALNLGENNRVLSVTYAEYAPKDAVIVYTIPSGNVYEYRYVDGVYVYDPAPQLVAQIVAPKNILAGECITIDGVLYLAMENIPNGEPVIVGQNAIKTTVEEQLYEMKGE